MQYRVVDVFAESKYQGNPLTVVLEAGRLSADEMQAIARETNHSETTFIRSKEPVDGAWPVRIFTPHTELPFAGHPTLGTAAVIAEVYGDSAPTLELQVGRVPVRQEEDLWWMEQPAPTIGERETAAACADLVGLLPEDVIGSPRIVDNGIAALIIPVADMAAVSRASLDRRDWPEWEDRAHTVLVFSEEAEDADLHVRVFAPGAGVDEDPATGSANGALAAFLCTGKGGVDVVAEQGVEMGRPSRLYLRAKAGEPIQVQVGGRVVPVAEGRLL